MDPLGLTLSIATAAAGLGGLVALHRFRVRPRPVAVATLLFWDAAAVTPAPHALGGRRFRRPWTFALLAAIVLLLAGAILAGARSVGRSAVVVVEGPTDLSADLPALPDNAALVDATNGPAVLLPPGTPKAVVADGARRLAVGVGPTAPASRAALLLASDLSAGRVVWYTASPLPPGLPADLVARVDRRPVPAVDEPVVTSVVALPDGTLAVRVGGAADAVFVDGPHPGHASVTDRSASLGPFPADGSTLTLRAARAGVVSPPIAVRLPNHPPLRFHLDAATSPAIRAAAAAVGTVVDGPDPDAIHVVLGPPPSPLPGGRWLYVDPAADTRRAAFLLDFQRRSQALVGWTDAPATVSAARQAADPLWPAVGEAPTVVSDPPAPPPAPAAPLVPAGLGEPAGWVLLAALALLLAEAALLAARRIA